MAILLIIFLFITAVWDLYTKKINNAWIISVWMFGFLILIARGGVGEIYLALVTSFFALVIGLVFWWFRVIGGADGKLLAWVGLFLGYPNGLEALFYVAVAGGVLAVMYLIKPVFYDIQMKKNTASRQVMPYVPAIFLGCLIYIISKI